MKDAKTCDEELLRKLDSAASPEVSGMLNRYFVAALCESAAARLRFKDAAIDNLAAEIERLRGENACLREATRWRKVEEELPSSTGWHLVRYQNDEMGQSWYRNGHGNWVDRQGKSQYPHYWQPLPEPPKEEK